MRFARLVACALSVAFVTSPAEAQLAPVPDISAESVAHFSGTGHGSVSGRVVANLPGDRVRYFDKWQVFIVPVIPYTYYLEHIVIDAWQNDAGNVPPADPAFSKLTRSTITNADGYFKFSNLPKGTYFVYTVVQVKDGRQETLTSSSYEQTGSTTYLRDGVPIGEIPDYGYVERPYTHDYTCDTQGVVGGAVAVEHEEAATVNLGLYGARNNGC